MRWILHKLFILQEPGRGVHYKQEQCVSLFFQTGKSPVRHFCCLLLSTSRVKYFLNCLDTIYIFGTFLTLSLKLMQWYITSVSRGSLYEKFGNKCVKILKFNLFVSIFIQSYVNIKLHMSTLYRY
jgi:hypothetical protein